MAEPGGAAASGGTHDAFGAVGGVAGDAVTVVGKAAPLVPARIALAAAAVWRNTRAAEYNAAALRQALPARGALAIVHGGAVTAAAAAATVKLTLRCGAAGGIRCAIRQQCRQRLQVHHRKTWLQRPVGGARSFQHRTSWFRSDAAACAVCCRTRPGQRPRPRDRHHTATRCKPFQFCHDAPLLGLPRRPRGGTASAVPKSHTRNILSLRKVTESTVDIVYFSGTSIYY